MNFSHLRKNDKVVIWQHGDYTPYLIATVLEVGAAKIKTDKGDFSAKSGKTWGYDGWYGNHLDDMTVEEAQERNKEIKARLHKNLLVRKLSDYNFRNCNIDVLEKIAEMVGIKVAEE